MVFWALTACIIGQLYSRAILMRIVRHRETYPYTDFPSLVDCVQNGGCRLFTLTIDDALYSILTQSSRNGLSSAEYQLNSALRKSKNDLTLAAIEDVVEIVSLSKPGRHNVVLLDETSLKLAL